MKRGLKDTHFEASDKKETKQFMQDAMNGNDMLFGSVKDRPFGMSFDCGINKVGNMVRNNHTIVIGTAGTGKGFNYIEPNLINLPNTKSNAIVIENCCYYDNYRKWLEDNGYTVYVLSDYLEDSNTLDVLGICRRVDSSKLPSLVDKIAERLSVEILFGSVKETDQFWSKTEKALATMLIWYTIRNEDLTFTDIFLLARNIASEASDLKCSDTETPTFAKIKAFLEGFEEKDYGRTALEIFLAAPVQTISAIFTSFMINTQYLCKGVMKTDIFNHSDKDIDLSLFNNDKVCLFVNFVPNKNQSVRVIPIITYAISYALYGLCEEKGAGSFAELPLNRHLQVYMDEANNYMLNIKTLPLLFALSRKYNIGISLIGQCFPVYEGLETICANADTVICTGLIEGFTEGISPKPVPDSFLDTIYHLKAMEGIFVWVRDYKPFIVDRIAPRNVDKEKTKKAVVTYNTLDAMYPHYVEY